jgi:hypothetical protein
MKKILTYAAIAATTLTLASNANAENTGCGFGSILFNGNKGVVPNILAVTTNGSSGSQTFGITSGTLGCNPNSYVKSSIKLFAFADENLNELASDTAKGNGAYLESVAQILDIKEADKSHFFTVMQDNFSSIFEGEITNTANVVASISNVMKKDSVLKSYKI